MYYEINWTSKARRQLKKIIPKDRIRILDAVDALKQPSSTKNVAPLINHTYAYRLKIGNYRVLFDIQHTIKIVEIQEVKKRDDNTY